MAMRTYYTVGKVRVGELAREDVILVEHDGHSEWRLVLDVWDDIELMKRQFGEKSRFVRAIEASKVLETKMYVVVRYMVEEDDSMANWIIRRRVELVDVQVPIS